MRNFNSNSFLYGNAKILDNVLTINVTLKKELDKDCVLRVFFVDKTSLELISLGLIEVSGKSGYFENKFDLYFDTVAITKKNAITGEIKYICAAFFEEEWEVYNAFDENVDFSVYHAKKLLDKIKDETSTKEGGDIIKKNYLSIINNKLASYSVYDENILEGFVFYKITDFNPIVPLSAYKYVLFERDVNYCFDSFGFYLFGINKNLTAIAILSQKDVLPLYHLKDFSHTKEINNIFYHIAIIELADDGQYFVT